MIDRGRHILCLALLRDNVSPTNGACSAWPQAAGHSAMARARLRSGRAPAPCRRAGVAASHPGFAAVRRSDVGSRPRASPGFAAAKTRSRSVSLRTRLCSAPIPAQVTQGDQRVERWKPAMRPSPSAVARHSPAASRWACRVHDGGRRRPRRSDAPDCADPVPTSQATPKQCVAAVLEAMSPVEARALASPDRSAGDVAFGRPPEFAWRRTDCPDHRSCGPRVWRRCGAPALPLRQAARSDGWPSGRGPPFPRIGPGAAMCGGGGVATAGTPVTLMARKPGGQACR
jgi:hypothetical protein